MTKGTYRYAKKSVRPFDYTWEINDLGKQVWQIRILHGVPRECENNGLIILTMEIHIQYLALILLSSIEYEGVWLLVYWDHPGTLFGTSEYIAIISHIHYKTELRAFLKVNFLTFKHL